MFAVKNGHGYDATFVSEVAADLKCVICKFVLRNPIQFMNCGHRLCKPCFVRMKEYSRHLNTGLICPVDREVVDVDMIFDDKGIARTIGNLQAQCGNLEDGCTWTGDLRDLEKHEESCVCRITQNVKNLPLQHAQEVGANVMVIDLLKRVQYCEESLVTKEKDLAHLKFSLHKLSENFDKKDNEVEILKKSNLELQTKINLIKTQNEELKKNFEEEIEEVKNENKRMETQVHALEVEVVEMKDGSKRETLTLKNCFQAKNISMEQRLSSLNNDLELVKAEIKQPQAQTLNDDIVTSKAQVDKIEVEVDVLKSLNDETNKINTRLDKVDKCTMEDSLVNHIENMENVLFSHHSLVNKEIKFKWVIQNYKYHFDSGKYVFSPIFFKQYMGYCFQLRVRWRGEQKEELGVFLKLHRDRSKLNTLLPFNNEYTLEVMDNKGNSKTNKVSHEVIEKFRDGSFTIHDGEDKVRYGCGNYMLTAPYDEYIINDSLFISCTLHL